MLYSSYWRFTLRSAERNFQLCKQIFIHSKFFCKPLLLVAVTSANCKNTNINLALEQPTVYIRRQCVNKYYIVIQVYLSYGAIDNCMHKRRSTEGLLENLILSKTTVVRVLVTLGISWYKTGSWRISKDPPLSRLSFRQSVWKLKRTV